MILVTYRIVQALVEFETALRSLVNALKCRLPQSNYTIGLTEHHSFVTLCMTDVKKPMPTSLWILLIFGIISF
jgi:hypothetical protein